MCLLRIHCESLFWKHSRGLHHSSVGIFNLHSKNSPCVLSFSFLTFQCYNYIIMISLFIERFVSFFGQIIWTQNTLNRERGFVTMAIQRHNYKKRLFRQPDELMNKGSQDLRSVLRDIIMHVLLTFLISGFFLWKTLWRCKMLLASTLKEYQGCSHVMTICF